MHQQICLRVYIYKKQQHVQAQTLTHLCTDKHQQCTCTHNFTSTSLLCLPFLYCQPLQIIHFSFLFTLIHFLVNSEWVVQFTCTRIERKTQNRQKNKQSLWQIMRQVGNEWQHYYDLLCMGSCTHVNISKKFVVNINAHKQGYETASTQLLKWWKKVLEWFSGCN